jgi:hypothetical protein
MASMGFENGAVRRTDNRRRLRRANRTGRIRQGSSLIWTCPRYRLTFSLPSDGYVSLIRNASNPRHGGGLVFRHIQEHVERKRFPVKPTVISNRLRPPFPSVVEGLEQSHHLVRLFILQQLLTVLNHQDVSFRRQPFVEVIQAFGKRVPILSKPVEELQRSSKFIHQTIRSSHLLPVETSHATVDSRTRVEVRRNPLRPLRFAAPYVYPRSLNAEKEVKRRVHFALVHAPGFSVGPATAPRRKGTACRAPTISCPVPPRRPPGRSPPACPAGCSAPGRRCSRRPWR